MKNTLIDSNCKQILLAACIILIPFITMGQRKQNKNPKRSKQIESVINTPDSLESGSYKDDRQAQVLTAEQRVEVMVSKYGKNKGRLIADGKVWASISMEMAVDSWGEPQQIQKSETSNGITEKWLYADGRYLFFKNGRLQSWTK